MRRSRRRAEHSVERLPSIGRRALFVVVLALSLSCSGPPASGVDRETVDRALFDLQLVPLEGRAPVPFRLDTLDGRTVSLDELRGRVVLLYFWASW